MLQNSIVSSLEHLKMLILEAHPFLLFKSPFNKLKMHKVGRVLKLRELLGLYNMNKIIF